MLLLLFPLACKIEFSASSRSSDRVLYPVEASRLLVSFEQDRVDSVVDVLKIYFVERTLAPGRHLRRVVPVNH